MAVFDTTDPKDAGSKEPIRFPGTKEERREQRMRRKSERKVNSAPENEPVLDEPPELFLPGDLPQYQTFEPSEEQPRREKRTMLRRGLQISWTYVSFLLMVALPGAAVGLYYAFIASPQFQIETQFSVRGASQSSMGTFGLGSLFGSTTQSSDSYIVASYIESVQLVRDIKDQLGIDIRQYYAKNNIDFWYRIDPSMPLEKFTEYWKDMVEVSFNSTTGNTTLFIYGFSADDSKAIADAVLKVSETLVNNLSEKNRQQMMQVANNQVDRSEKRLLKVRKDMQDLRSKEKTISPEILVKGGAELSQKLENELLALRTRYDTLTQSVSKDSPSARTMAKQIKSAEDALRYQKQKIDGGNGARVADTKDGTNVAEVVNKFEELTVQDKFATTAYTTSLAAFETALAEAQKQERYFATFVAPMRPEVALYPYRILDTFIALLVFGAIWLISQFLYRSFRDHAI